MLTGFRFKLVAAIGGLAFTISADGEICLRLADEQSLEVKLQVLAPVGAERNWVRDTIKSKCPEARMQEHIYVRSPLKRSVGGAISETWSWIKVSEGPYRFAKRLFLRSDVVGTIYFDREGKVSGHNAKIYTDSL